MIERIKEEIGQLLRRGATARAKKALEAATANIRSEKRWSELEEIGSALADKFPEFLGGYELMVESLENLGLKKAAKRARQEARDELCLCGFVEEGANDLRAARCLRDALLIDQSREFQKQVRASEGSMALLALLPTRKPAKGGRAKRSGPLRTGGAGRGSQNAKPRSRDGAHDNALPASMTTPVE